MIIKLDERSKRQGDGFLFDINIVLENANNVVAQTVITKQLYRDYLRQGCADDNLFEHIVKEQLIKQIMGFINIDKGCYFEFGEGFIEDYEKDFVYKKYKIVAYITNKE